MKTKRWGIRVVALIGLVVALLIAGTVQAAPHMRWGGPGGGGGGGGGGGSGSLNADEIAALDAAVEEEYLARNSYRAVIAQFGSIAPFSNIANSEQNHIDAVNNLRAKYGLLTPQDFPLPTGWPTSWQSVRDACALGVLVEIDDIDLYDRLFQTNIVHGDILQVFTNLQSASINHHLPAFQGCD